MIMKSLAMFLLLVAPLMGQEQFPEAPQPVRQNASGGYEVDRAKLPKKQPIFTKTWLGAHAFYLGTEVYDAEMTHEGLAHHRCREGNLSLGAHPSRGDLYRSNLIEWGLVSGIDLLMQAAHPPKAFKWVPYMGAAYGSQDHLRGGTSWLMGCW